MELAGFEWDDGNWPKCAKHGVSRAEIEHALGSGPFVQIDRGSFNEMRFNAVGRNAQGRYLFIVFTLREGRDGVFLRPISARYMHQKEIDHYAQQKGL